MSGAELSQLLVDVGGESDVPTLRHRRVHELADGGDGVIVGGEFSIEPCLKLIDPARQLFVRGEQSLLEEHGITCSMSRSGNCWDNAVTESCFSSMKTERTDEKLYATRDQAKADVFDYIERFYNPRRRHSTLNYFSPIEYE